MISELVTLLQRAHQKNDILTSFNPVATQSAEANIQNLMSSWRRQEICSGDKGLGTVWNIKLVAGWKMAHHCGTSSIVYQFSRGEGGVLGVGWGTWNRSPIRKRSFETHKYNLKQLALDNTRTFNTVMTWTTFCSRSQDLKSRLVCR